MEPTLMVIGLNHRTAPVAMRERFWIGDNRRYEVLRQLHSAEGIDEVVVLSTCMRTEFWLWAVEPTLAANSLLQFLSAEHGLKLTEWEHFYRRLDDTALAHIFRVTAGLDSVVLGNAHITSHVSAAWEQAQAVGAAGGFLSLVVERALQVCQRIHQDTSFTDGVESLPALALELARQTFGTLHDRNMLLLGTGVTSYISPQYVAENGIAPVVVIDQSAARARELSDKLGGTAAGLGDRWNCMLRADIVISATGCPHVVLTREEAERIALERNRVALMIIDLGMPRDVDPEVRRVDGILLYDLDGLERAKKNFAPSPTAADAVADAEKIIAAETQAFRSQLQAECNVPTSVALRARLEELCRQELEFLIAERGPFTREQNQLLHAITAQVIQKIASSLTRELKELPGRAEQDRMTAVVTRLFHLASSKQDSTKQDAPSSAPAGATSQGEEDDRDQHRAIAI